MSNTFLRMYSLVGRKHKQLKPENPLFVECVVNTPFFIPPTSPRTAELGIVLEFGFLCLWCCKYNDNDYNGILLVVSFVDGKLF